MHYMYRILYRTLLPIGKGIQGQTVIGEFEIRSVCLFMVPALQYYSISKIGALSSLRWMVQWCSADYVMRLLCFNIVATV